MAVRPPDSPLGHGPVPPAAHQAQGSGSTPESARIDQEHFRAWFETVSAQIGGLARGAIVRIEDDEVAGELARWPAASADPVDARARRLAHEACVDRQGRFEPFAGSTGDAWLLAYPVLMERHAAAVVLVELAAAQPVQLQRAMNALQWGCAWIELRLFRERDAAQSGERSGVALALLAQMLERDGSSVAGMALVQELARASMAERVSLGLGRLERLRLVAISDVTEFDPRMNEVRQLEAAMREAIAEGGPVVCADGGSAGIRPAHDALQRLAGSGHVETFPLFARGEPVGAVVFEHRAGPVSEASDISALESTLALSARVLQLQVEAGESAWQRAARFWRQRLESLFGPGAHRGKTAMALMLLAAAFFTFAQGEYRLTADALIEPAFQRVVTVPWNGYLAQASVRPGDEVVKGQVLLRLDDREQHLERVRWTTEVEKLRKKANQAIASHDRPGLSVLTAQLRQAEAQLELIDSQLARVDVPAPFDGLVVSGDPTQRLGDALKKGEVVYQIAPLHAYRVVVRVPESRVADLARGMRGTMQLASIPDLTLGITVERIHPFTQRRDGQSFFAVEAVIDGDVDRVRPGMEGVAAIGVDRRNLFGIWTRGLLEWVRLKWWSLPG